MNPLFVLGAPRSGTSYLARSLALAENVAYWEEEAAFSVFGARSAPLFYSECMKSDPVFKYSAMRSGACALSDFLRGKDRLNDLLTSLYLHTHLEPHDLEPSARLTEIQKCSLTARDADDLQNLYARIKQGQPKEGIVWALQEMFSTFSTLCGGKTVLEKTPDHFFYIPVIKAVFPDARFVVIVRDKRECVASFIKTFGVKRKFLADLFPEGMMLHALCREYLRYAEIEEWTRTNLAAKQLNYEEFIAAPLEKTAEICEWAGLAFDREQHRDLFKTRSLTPKWDRLHPKQQRIILKYFG
jgi:hypothetical protein